jgi:hypothetical protein
LVGVAILAAFAGVGVAWPMYVMSTGPTGLASVRWFIWPFSVVLAALIIYVVVYLFNLSRRQLPTVGAQQRTIKPGRNLKPSRAAAKGAPGGGTRAPG